MLQDFFNPVRYSKVSSDSSIDVFYQWGGKTATLKRKRSCGDQALGLPVPHMSAPFPAWRSFSSSGQQGLGRSGWIWPGFRAKLVHVERL